MKERTNSILKSKIKIHESKESLKIIIPMNSSARGLFQGLRPKKPQNTHEN